MNTQFIRECSDVLKDFTFYYPLFMAYVWMIGAVNYYFTFERGVSGDALPRPGAFADAVSIVIPMHNEAANARDTVTYALQIDYPVFEVIGVNDGSTEGTGELLDSLAAADERLRVVHLAANQGEAIALEMGTLVARNEFIV